MESLNQGKTLHGSASSSSYDWLAFHATTNQRPTEEKESSKRFFPRNGKRNLRNTENLNYPAAFTPSFELAFRPRRKKEVVEREKERRAFATEVTELGGAFFSD